MRARVRLHDLNVGVLQEAGGLTTFRFSSSYLEMPERPILGRWFEDRLGPEVVAKRTQSQLPPFFQNVLPEVNSALRTLLAQRARVPENRELRLLAALGEDLPGAMVVEPESNGDDDSAPDIGARSSGPLADAAPEGPLRFSLAGMQLKLSVLLRDEKLTLPATGAGGRYILKLPTATLPRVPQNEHAVMTWARESGLHVAATRLVRIADIENLPPGLPLPEEEALLVERYDRPADGGARIHQEDFAQVFGVPPTDKYGREAGVTFDRLGKVIAQVAGRTDFEEFVRRLVFSILCQNPDAHLKNWSFWYPDPRRPRLSPAYDLVSASVYPGVHRELACRLASEWDPSRIRTHHFGILASHAGFPAADGVALAEEAGQRIRAAWARLPDRVPVPAYLQTALAHHLEQTKLP
jgi:serine/threonine-protein kinase HipA